MPPSGGQPKYWLIAAQLREDVQSGAYPPGSRLPGENDLMRQFGVARGTARQALSTLIGWGIAVSRKGSGIYVRTFAPIISERIGRLSESWQAGQSVWSAETEGRSFAVDQVEVGVTDAPERVRTLLALGDGEQVVMRSRRMAMDGKPVLLSRSWLPASIAAGTPIAERETGPGGTFARLADLGYAPVHFREDVQSRMPDPDDAVRLEMVPGTPAVEISRTAFDASGRVVELNEMTADASAYVFRYEFDA